MVNLNNQTANIIELFKQQQKIELFVGTPSTHTHKKIIYLNSFQIFGVDYINKIKFKNLKKYYINKSCSFNYKILKLKIIFILII